MRILFTADTYPPNVNGAALATQRIIIELKKRGHEMFVIAPSTEFRNYVKEENGIPVYRLRSILVQKNQQFRVSPQMLINMRAMRTIIKEVNPDVIHVNNPGFICQCAIKVAKELNIPLVGTSHFMPENIVHYLRLPNPIENLVNSIVWMEYARTYGKLDAIISPTQTAADLFQKYKAKYKVKDIHVISNGLDLTRFNPNNDGSALKQKYQLPDKVTLMFVGRLDKEKKLDEFVRAMAQIKDKSDFHAVIVGKGKEDQPLHELAQELGVLDRITFTGYVSEDDLPKMYTLAQIFVMPSIAELQSLVTMEAMATGQAVIGANAVALPHLIHNDKNGYLFTPGNITDFAEKLLKVITDTQLRKRMSQQSLEMIKEHDMNHVIDETEKVYHGVIDTYKKSHHLNDTEKPTLKKDRLLGLDLNNIGGLPSRIRARIGI
jgi:glycosyltransferase involved in cell wall biosynthesis